MKPNAVAYTLSDVAKESRCSAKSARVSRGTDAPPLPQRTGRVPERSPLATPELTAATGEAAAAATSLVIGPGQPVLSSMTGAEYQLTLGRELERSCLARELHDSVIQQLLGISYRLVPPRDSLSMADAREVVDATRQEILDVITQLRGMIGTLRPIELQELGLVTALRRYAGRIRREQSFVGAAIELDLDASADQLPDLIALCLLRTAQELLRNALKHGQAQRILLRLHRGDTAVTLSVHDDGCGFQIPANLSDFAEHEHYGLLGVAERVAEVNGSVTLRSQPALGTQIVVQIPLPPASEQHLFG